MHWSIDVLSEILKDTTSALLAAVLADRIIRALAKRCRRRKR